MRMAGFGFGVVFGFLLCWSALADPDVIRAALLFEDWYLYALFPSAVAVGFVGTRLLRTYSVRALLTREPVAFVTARPETRHVAGSILFGVGWAVAAACPGPVVAQLGRGLLWSLCTAGGIVLGIVLYFWRRDRVAQASERRSSGVLTFASSASSTATTAASSSASAS
jgi:hypothetical protein